MIKIKELYNKLCELEKLTPLPIKFERVGKGGACVTYNPRTMQPLYISFDLNRIGDLEYGLYHEMAHQYCLINYKYPGHGAKFTKHFNRINDKYMYSKIVEPYMKENTSMKLTKQLLKEEIRKVLLELTYKDLRSDAKSEFLDIRKKSEKTPYGTRYRGITKDGLLHFVSVSFTDHDHYYDQYIQLLDLQKYITEFTGKLQPIEIIRKVLEGDIKVHCTDPSWKYWGFQYKGTKNNYAIEPETRFPKVRNPKLEGAVCKHIDSCLYVLPFLATKITADLKKLGVFK